MATMTPEQKIALTMVCDSATGVRLAQQQLEDNMRRAVEAGVTFSDIGRAVGTSGRAAAYLAARRGWYRPGERRG